jgi:hypothetical protein
MIGDLVLDPELAKPGAPGANLRNADYGNIFVSKKRSIAFMRSLYLHLGKSTGHPMLLLVVINLLVGALLGVRFTVFIVIPAAVAASVEAILLEPATGSWGSLVWHAVVLILAIEVGFILGAVWRPS